MTPIRTFVLALAVAVGAAACGDDGVTPDEETDPLEPFVGSWSASSFVYTSVENPEISVPILDVVEGSSVAVTVEPDGTFLSAINLGAQTGNQTVEVPGTIEHEGGDQITVTFATNPFFTEPLEVTYDFQTQSTLTWQTLTTFDFNQDETPEPATLDVVFQRN